jgi:hypothetical protein
LFVRSLSKDFDCVILHSLSGLHQRILAWLPNHLKIIWIGWGFDYYDLIDIDLLKPKTRLLKDSFLDKSNHKLNLLRVLKKYVKERSFFEGRKKKLFHKINFFSPVLYEDYLLLERDTAMKLPPYISWNYGTLEIMTDKTFDLDLSNSNIMIGNSGAFTNNHLDIFDNIKHLVNKNRKIVVPLSYGGDPHYQKEVVRIGEKMFQGNFIPLVEFLPYEQYMKVVSSCSIVIMNQLRQQGLGNIVALMYRGSKIFLDERNPVYSFFKSRGAFVYSLTELDFEIKNCLTPEQIEKNREILRSAWSEKVIFLKTKQMITNLFLS